MQPSKTRTLEIRGKIYQYRIGRTFLSVRFPDGKKHLIGLSELKGADVNRGRWKKTSDGMICPSDVRRFIDIELVKENQ